MSTQSTTWFGTKARPVTTFIDRNAVVSSEKSRSSTARSILQWSSKHKQGIFVLGHSFGPVKALPVNEMEKSFAEKLFIGNLSPPSYPPGWTGVTRSLDTLNNASATLYRLRMFTGPLSDGIKAPFDFLESLDVVIKMSLASYFVDDDSHTHSVHSLSRFLVTLPVLLGHRDFLRVIVGVKDTANTGSTSVTQEGCMLSSCDEIPWQPNYNSLSSYTVTIVVLPSKNQTGSMPSSSGGMNEGTPDFVDKQAKGIYVILSRDVGQAVSIRSPPREERYFEYVRHNSPNYEHRQFFVALGCGMTFPANMVMRFYSSSECDVQISVFVNNILPHGMRETLASHTIKQKLFPSSKGLPRLNWPHPPTSPVSTRKGTQEEKAQSSAPPEDDIGNPLLVQMGCVPSYKGVYSGDLRSHILEEVQLRRTTTVGIEGNDVFKHPVCYITQNPRTSMSYINGNHIQTDVSMQSKVSNVPVPRMLAMMKREGFRRGLWNVSSEEFYNNCYPSGVWID